jgi:GT2 family glycosyltransferase
VKILIGIPTLNGPDRLRRALFAIHEYTDLNNVSLVVSDDASNANNLEWNKTWCHRFNVPLLTTEIRLGIPKQWNRLVRHVPDADVCVLVNDDVEVVADWLDVLVFALDKNPQLGMVGLRCETGVTARVGEKRTHVDYQESHLLDGSGTLLSSGGACFAFRRKDWEAVGGFDERFFCFYEELDFGVRLMMHGKHNVIANYPIVYHMGGATIGANSDASAVLLESRARFTEKYEGMTLDTMRLDFGRRPRQTYLEWNSQWKNWRLP